MSASDYAYLKELAACFEALPTPVVGYCEVLDVGIKIVLRTPACTSDRIVSWGTCETARFNPLTEAVRSILRVIADFEQRAAVRVSEAGTGPVSDQAPGQRMADITKDIGRRLHRMRVLSGRSQAWLAEAVGVTFQQIQKYETGQNRISAARLVLLAAALRCPVQALVPTSSQ